MRFALTNTQNRTQWFSPRRTSSELPPPSYKPSVLVNNMRSILGHSADQPLPERPGTELPQPLKEKQNTAGFYRWYGTNACGQCARKAACTRSAKGRQIKGYAGDDTKDRLHQQMQQPENRERYLKRQGKVEPVFSQMRYLQGLNRFRRKGLACARNSAFMHWLTICSGLLGPWGLYTRLL